MRSSGVKHGYVGDPSIRERLFATVALIDRSVPVLCIRFLLILMPAGDWRHDCFWREARGRGCTAIASYSEQVSWLLRAVEY